MPINQDQIRAQNRGRINPRRKKQHQYLVDLSLTPEQLEQFYAGQVNQVWARDIRGVSIQFPLRALRPFVTHSGVSGRFKLQVSQDHRLSSITKL